MWHGSQTHLYLVSVRAEGWGVSGRGESWEPLIYDWWCVEKLTSGREEERRLDWLLEAISGEY